MSSAAMTSRRAQPGRPRHIPASSVLAPRDQVLHAAARLFVDKGFAGTSTRVIADEVGIRQASIYYHFRKGKDEILAALLEMTVRPALDSLDQLARVETPEARLYLLALSDARALAELMHNIGILPGLPDVASSEYDAARRELRDAYASLGLECASAAVVRTVSRTQLGNLILENVESVVRTRTTGHVFTDRELHNIAAASLRLCGVTDGRVDEAARTASPELLPELTRACD